MHGTIAQYYDFPTLENFEEKLGQFPTGTQFVFSPSSSASEAAAEIRKFGAARGLAIMPRAAH
jgi:hypothetical protein